MSIQASNHSKFESLYTTIKTHKKSFAAAGAVTALGVATIVAATMKPALITSAILLAKSFTVLITTKAMLIGGAILLGTALIALLAYKILFASKQNSEKKENIIPLQSPKDNNNQPVEKANTDVPPAKQKEDVKPLLEGIQKFEEAKKKPTASDSDIQLLQKYGKETLSLVLDDYFGDATLIENLTRNKAQEKMDNLIAFNSFLKKQFEVKTPYINLTMTDAAKKLDEANFQNHKDLFLAILHNIGYENSIENFCHEKILTISNALNARLASAGESPAASSNEGEAEAPCAKLEGKDESPYASSNEGESDFNDEVLREELRQVQTEAKAQIEKITRPTERKAGQDYGRLNEAISKADELLNNPSSPPAFIKRTKERLTNRMNRLNLNGNTSPLAK